ncbi:17117_t:CDS:2, partial [Racocetra fulgida]
TTSLFPANGKLPVVATSDLKVTTVPLTSNPPGPQSVAPTIQKIPTSNASPTSVFGASPTSVSGASPTSVSRASPTSAPIKSNDAPTQKPNLANSSKSSITKTVFSTVATFVPGFTSAVTTTDSNGDVTVVNAYVPPTTIVAVNSVVTAVPADDQNSMAFSSANISSSFWGMWLSLGIGFISFLLVA